MSLCRTCLQQVSAQSCISLNHIACQSEGMKIEDKLIACVPELDLNLIENSIICYFCFDALEVSYGFKQKCLQTEKLIRIANDTNLVVLDFNENLKEVFAGVKMEKDCEGQYGTDKFSFANELQESDVDEQCEFVDGELQESNNNLINNINQDFNIITTVKEEIKSVASDLLHEDFIIDDTESIDTKSEPASLTATGKKDEKVLETSRVKEEKPLLLFTCEVCRYVAEDERKFWRHVRIHTNEKPEEKPFRPRSACKKTVKTRMKFHTRQNFFKCSECNYKTKRSDSLKRHVKTHADFSSLTEYFECNECGRRFMRKEHLRRHVIIHTGEKPFHCPLCQYKCQRRDHLQQHVKAVHRYKINEEAFLT